MPATSGRSKQTHFRLNAENWDAFMTALDAPPRQHARLHRLLDKPSVFDGAASDRRLDRHPE